MGQEMKQKNVVFLNEMNFMAHSPNRIGHPFFSDFPPSFSDNAQPFVLAINIIFLGSAQEAGKGKAIGYSDTSLLASLPFFSH